jgi:nitrate/TMAO reductase-like tetraheme cytochrome c subunit
MSRQSIISPPPNPQPCQKHFGIMASCAQCQKAQDAWQMAYRKYRADKALEASFFKMHGLWTTKYGDQEGVEL